MYLIDESKTILSTEDGIIDSQSLVEKKGIAGLVLRFRIFIKPQNTLLVPELYKVFSKKITDIRINNLESEESLDYDFIGCRVTKIDMGEMFESIGDGEKIPIETVKIWLEIQAETSDPVSAIYQNFKASVKITFYDSSFVQKTEDNQLKIEFEETGQDD